MKLSPYNVAGLTPTQKFQYARAREALETVITADIKIEDADRVYLLRKLALVLEADLPAPVTLLED